MQRFTSHRCSLSTCSKAMFFRNFLNLTASPPPTPGQCVSSENKSAIWKEQQGFKKVNVLNLLWVYRSYHYLYIYIDLILYISSALMILMRYSLQIEHSLRLCFQPPLTVPWTLGSRAIKTVRPPHGAGLRAQQVPHRTDFAVAGRPKNVPAASARAATPLQPTSPKWLTVHRLGKLLTAVVQKWLDDSIFWSYPKIFLTNKSTPTFKLLTISHHAFLLAT